MSHSPPFQSQSTKGLSPFDLHTYSALRRILSTSQGFAFINQAKPFNDALAYCRENFHDLASIHNDEEFSQVASICPDDSGCWIGGTDATAEGVWTWTDSSEWDYEKWKNGEPSNTGFAPLIEGSGEHHLRIDVHGFNDHTGSGPTRFICSGDPCTATQTPQITALTATFTVSMGTLGVCQDLGWQELATADATLVSVIQTVPLVQLAIVGQPVQQMTVLLQAPQLMTDLTATSTV